MSNPPPPDDLLEAAQERWAAFWSSEVAKRVDQVTDMPRLVRWIEQSDQYDRIRAEVDRNWTVLGSTGQTRINPLLTYLSQLDTQLSRTEAEFGMTPLARQKLRAAPVPQDTPKDALDELKKRRQAKAGSA